MIEQRPLRLGDIVDDYCPRERRISNHAIVVMTGADIHSTRCTACESEHPYKHAKAPLRRAPEAHDNGGGHLVKPAIVQPAAAAAPGAAQLQTAESADDARSGEAAALEAPASDAQPDAPDEIFHRPLIRAALPKGVVPSTPRPLPDFTMRHLRHRDRSNGRRFSR